MKKLFALAAVLAMSAPLTAFAADLPQPPPPMPRAPAFVPVAPFTWTGVYAGINGGYAWGNVTDGFGDSFNSNGGIFGGTFGFNYQWGWFVAGFEGDIDWSGQKNSQSASASLLGGGVAATATYKNAVLSTFAARFGVASDHWLFYGKAGGAWTEEKFSANGSVVIPAVGTIVASEADSFSRLGWMAGAGVEYAFTNNLTAKVEYNYIDFGSNSENLNFTGTLLGSGLAATATLPITSKLHDNVVKVGLNWLFNGS